MKTALFSRPDMPAPDASKAAPEPSVATDPRITSANSGAAFWDLQAKLIKTQFGLLMWATLDAVLIASFESTSLWRYCLIFLAVAPLVVTGGATAALLGHIWSAFCRDAAAERDGGPEADRDAAV